jgi:hypothetical protein
MLRRLMVRRVPICAALLAAVALGACGGSHASDKAQIEKTVTGVYDALADKDAKRICDSISEQGKKKISETASKGSSKKRSCEQVFTIGLAVAGDQLKQAKDVKVSDVKLDGDRARATVSLQNRKSDVGLVKEDGNWKLSGLDLTGS